jgi:Asp-tRNA(Asn)/Glu-tRNA(Gln) amidotransferase A subunit family amidase
MHMPETITTTPESPLTQPTSSSHAITSLSAATLARLIRGKQLSPVEVIEAYLMQIERFNPAINAFSHVDAEGARAAALEAETTLMRGDVSGPLHGVPLTIKSCIDVRGFPCEAGSKLRVGYIAEQDAALVARLREAGAIIIGNTSTPEALVAYHTENALQGRTCNPWDLTRTAGGSSGGEAAAIACGMSGGGIGSDGGGSIRVPASFCGIAGLKPTPGTIPGIGHYPPCAGPFSLIGVVGPMARTVEDLQLLLEITSGYDPGDPTSLPTGPSIQPDRSKKKLRIGFYQDDGYNSPMPEVRDAVQTAANVLSENGFEVEPFRPEGLGRVRELWFTIFVEAIAMVLKQMIYRREDEINNNTKEFLALAAEQPPLTGERLLYTLLERDAWRSQIFAQMEQFPILLAPVCSTPAFLHQDGGWGPAHAADYVRTMSYSQHYNLLGNPAATVPVTKTVEGLPIGVQVIGRPYKEEEVLAVAGILEHLVANKIDKSQ